MIGEWTVYLIGKMCGDLIVSRIDCSLAHALAALREVCIVDRDGHVYIEMSAFEYNV
jgi:hypothetical protein